MSLWYWRLKFPCNLLSEPIHRICLFSLCQGSSLNHFQLWWSPKWVEKVAISTYVGDPNKNQNCLRGTCARSKTENKASMARFAGSYEKRLGKWWFDIRSRAASKSTGNPALQPNSANKTKKTVGPQRKKKNWKEKLSTLIRRIPVGHVWKGPGVLP